MTVSEQIIEVLNVLCAKLGIVIDWTADNIVPYMEELFAKFIQFEIYTSIFWLVFWSAFALMLWCIATPLCVKASQLDWNYESYYLPTCAVWITLIACFFTIIAIVVSGVQIYDIIEAKVFPEKTLYDYITYQLSLSRG